MSNQLFLMTPWTNPWRMALQTIDNVLLSGPQIIGAQQEIGPLFLHENRENFWVLNYQGNIFIGREIYGLKPGDLGKNWGLDNLFLMKTLKSQWVLGQPPHLNEDNLFLSLRSFDKSIFAHSLNHWFSYFQKSTFDYVLLGHWSDAEIVVG